MDLQMISAAVNQVRQIFTTRSSTKRCIETETMKPAFRPLPIASPFPRATPESKGIPSRVLTEYYAALRDSRELDMHSVTVLKDGAVVAEGSFGAYDRSVWHTSYSECKSVVGLAIGMLIDEGRLSLDDKVVKLLSSKAPKLSLLTLKDLTVRHLLTMTSGVVFNEAGSVTETDWVRSFLESTPRSEPGARFNYNSMNTYMLSAIICEVTGESLTEFLRPRLWEPLDIGRVWWEKCPMGIEKGGWGLYLRQEDFAKIGQLILNYGEWDGRQLVSREWIEQATSAQVSAPESYGDFDYGYQIWSRRDGHCFLFSGMFGQNVAGWFDTGVLLVSNAGNDELFQQSGFFPLTQAALGRDFGEALPPDRAAREELRRTLSSLAWQGRGSRGRGLKRRRELPPECSLLEGRSYVATSANAPSVGLLPLAVQALQNIYTHGLEGFSFRREGEKLILTVREADTRYELPLGFDSPERLELDFRGEIHQCAVTARFARNEDGDLTLIARLSLLETAASRHIRMYFSPDLREVRCRWTETPGRVFMENGLEDVLAEIKLHPVAAGLLGKAELDYVRFKIRSAFEPELTAVEEESLKQVQTSFI